MSRIIVVGSGASAVHAAQALVESGAQVLMLDVGHRDDVYTDLVKPIDFEELRRTDPEQHRYLLGDNFEGIPFGPVRVGAQLTPPRKHISYGAPDALPADSPEFQAMHSLALGGLAAGWGAAVPPYTDDDMAGWPIGRRDLQSHYDTVARRIGISGTANDDLEPFLGPSPGLMPSPRRDSNAAYIYDRYDKNRERLNGDGFHMGDPRLAIATERIGDRGPLRYLDMEFWADRDRAVYRPVYTLEELKRHPNFEYVSGCLVESFERQPDDNIVVRGKMLEEGTTQEFSCARLILGAGAIGTARIVLRSLGIYNQPVPILANPYTYYPCLVWPRLGRPVRNRRHSLTQLMIYGKVAGPLVQGQIYSYRSLLTFKLLKESPLPFRESIRVMQLLQSYFIILGIHHEDRANGRKTLSLEQGNPPGMTIRYAAGEKEIRTRRDAERALVRGLRSLGALPMGRIDPGPGSSIHYGGTFPMSKEPEPLHTRPNGELVDAAGVYLVDGSVLPHLPAKGLTYTIMANADRIATELMR